MTLLWEIDTAVNPAWLSLMQTAADAALILKLFEVASDGRRAGVGFFGKCADAHIARAVDEAEDFLLADASRHDRDPFLRFCAYAQILTQF